MAVFIGVDNQGAIIYSLKSVIGEQFFNEIVKILITKI
jgi:hypothetical protein